jgi:S-formylglutathione hydrolase FrmB
MSSKTLFFAIVTVVTMGVTPGPAGATVVATRLLSPLLALASASSAADDFNRADGGLGANWVAMSDGGLSVSSLAVVGSARLAGDVWVGKRSWGDQFSQVAVTSTQLTGGQWIGPSVRVQDGGQNMYLGIYFWNNGSPVLRLYKRRAGAWIQLGRSYDSGPLTAGTTLKVVAVGSRVSFLQNGVERIAVSDRSLSGGAPGIMSYGAARAHEWSGGSWSRGTRPVPYRSGTTPSGGNASPAGTPRFQVVYQGTNASGVATYAVTSSDNGYGTQVLRVLAPSKPDPGVPHNFLYVLPVDAGTTSPYGDGLETLRALDAQDRYNLTIVEPSFEFSPWYADNPNDAKLDYETFMTNNLVPWVAKHLATTGHEQNWLIGFSKSGLGAQDLILRHPDLFTLAASWDFPADMTSYDQYGSSSADCYGTEQNFQDNYRLTPAFVNAHKTPFVHHNRLWIGGYSAFKSAVSDYDALLTSDGIAHMTEKPQAAAHSWGSGWVPLALAALRQDSVPLGATRMMSRRA